MSQTKPKRKNEHALSGSLNHKKVKFNVPQNQEQSQSAKDLKKQAKELRKQRRIQRPGGDVLESVKALWVEAGKTNLSDKDRREPINNLFKALQSHYVEALVKNDGSRMVETVVKYCTEEQRGEVVKELTGHFVKIARNRYGRHIVTKLLQCSPSSRAVIISEFSGKLLSCLKHKYASSIVDTIYSDYCKVAQRNDLMHEFYGKEYCLFKDYSGLSLEEILARNPEKQEGILAKLKTAIDSVLVKESTNLVHHSVVHRLIFDYVKLESPQKLKAWIPSIQDVLVEIIHTTDGVKAAILMIAMSGAKERKAFIKSCRPHLEKIIKDEAAHLIVIALCLFVDDTVLVEKTFLAELLRDSQSSLLNKYSRNILTALYGGVTGRNNFPKDIVDLFGKACSLSSSKKPADLRQKELCSITSPVLKDYFAPKLEGSLKSVFSSQLFLEMLLSDCAEDVFSMVLELFKANPSLLEQVYCRDFMKKVLKRIDEERLVKLLDAFGPLENLFATDAAFILIAVLDRNEEIRNKISLAITRLAVITDSAKLVADLCNKLNAGVPIHNN